MKVEDEVVLRERLSQEVIYKDLLMENAADILTLIRNVYGEDYTEKEYYDIDVIREYIRRTPRGCWMGAFLKGKLIAQMLAFIEKGICIVKLAMIEENYKKFGIIKELAILMEKKLIDNFNEAHFKVFYAFIDWNNIAMQKILLNAQFKIYGRVPAWESNRYYNIYGRIVYDNKWKLIRPHRELCSHIFEIIKKVNIHRLLAIDLKVPSISGENEEFLFKIDKEGNNFLNSYRISYQDNLCAIFSENIFNKSWFNFEFLANIDLSIKYKMIKHIIDLFYKTESINSFSIAVDVNDKDIQSVLLKSNMKYYAYLPFFKVGSDEILLGISKIEN